MRASWFLCVAICLAPRELSPAFGKRASAKVELPATRPSDNMTRAGRRVFEVVNMVFSFVQVSGNRSHGFVGEPLPRVRSPVLASTPHTIVGEPMLVTELIFRRSVSGSG